MQILPTIQTDNLLYNKVKALQPQIGHTALWHFSKMYQKPGVRIYGKLEWNQLGESVKARAAYNIILRAIENGQLTADKTLLDATSGNTGIAYASIARAAGIKVALCLPENASEARKNILADLGAEIIFTSRFEGTDGSQQVARSLADKYPDRYYYASQYTNENNWKAHYNSTAPEIFNEVCGITHFVAGLGTTGTFTGTGRGLKELKPSIRLISLQPDVPMHGLEGWKHLETAIIPTIYDSSLADEMLEVSTEEAYEMIKKVAYSEGLLISPSAAANLAGAIKVANKIEEGIVVTILPDNANKYREVIKSLI